MTQRSSRLLTPLALVAMVVASGALAETPVGSGGTPRVLSEKELTRYIGALGDVMTVSREAEASLSANPSDAQSLAQGIAHNEKLKAAIESHGFTAESFTDVHWNAMMAYAALEMKGKEAELAEARRQQAAALENMKDKLPPEQYQQMVRGMSALTQMFDAYENVPPENVALVEKHRPNLQAIIEP